MLTSEYSIYPNVRVQGLGLRVSRCVVTITSLYRKWHRDIWHYLQTGGSVHLAEGRPQTFYCPSQSQRQNYIATDGRSIIKSWCRAPSGGHDQIFITLFQLRSCFCGAPSLKRGQVCLLNKLLALSIVVFLGSESLGTHDHILLSEIWDFPFRRLLRIAGSRWRYSTPPPQGLFYWLSLSLSHIATDGQSVCLSWCRAPSGAHHQILVTVWQLQFCPWGAPSLTRGGVCLLLESVSSNKSIFSMYSYIHFTCFTWYDTHIQYIQGLCQFGLSTVIYILHALHDMTLIYNIYKASVSSGSVQQIMPYFW
jgi:hypothetical protein